MNIHCSAEHFSEDIYDSLADALTSCGYGILEDAFPVSLTSALAHRVKDLSLQGMQAAGIGRQNDHQLNHTERSDEIHWLEAAASSEESEFLQAMEELRQAINQRLFMGLFDYECHFAHYPPGAFYRRHLDAFKGKSNRVLSTVFYLNEQWPKEGAGGELLMYDEAADRVLERLAPRYGRLVVFLSDRFPHEVLPSECNRYSIAGWFRLNNSSSNRVDPAA